MSEVYESIIDEIQNNGFYVTEIEQMGTWDRVTVCSKQRPSGGYSGNSFWIACLSDNWYLGTWGGMLYRLPDKNRIVEICIEWLSSESKQTKPDFDEALKSRYGLIITSDEEFDAEKQKRQE